MSRTIPPDQWAAYLRAGIRIDLGSRVLRVLPDPTGETQGEFPKVLGRTIHVITAANPFGRVVSAEDNAQAQQALRRELLRFNVDAIWNAVGGDLDGDHTEESLAVVGLSDSQARDIGLRFSQDAIFAWTPRTLAVLSCVSDEVSLRGWRETV